MTVPLIHRPSLPVPLPLTRGGLGAITAAGGRTTLGLGTVAVEDYEEGDFLVTATGFTATLEATATYIRIGKLVNLVLPGFSGTSNATTFTLTGIPAGLTPAITFLGWASVMDNGVGYAGMIYFGVSDTVMQIFSAVGFQVFTASGTKQLNGAIMTYPLP